MQVPEETDEKILRIKRATSKPGFFRTLFSVIFEVYVSMFFFSIFRLTLENIFQQWNDTRNTVGSIRKMIDDNFIPDDQAVSISYSRTFGITPSICYQKAFN